MKRRKGKDTYNHPGKRFNFDHLIPGVIYYMWWPERGDMGIVVLLAGKSRRRNQGRFLDTQSGQTFFRHKKYVQYSVFGG